MFSPKWFVGLFMIWMVAAIISTMTEMTWIGENETALFTTIQNLPIFSGNAGFFDIIATIFSLEAWAALGTIFIWDFAMFEGGYAIIRWVVLMPLSLALMVSFAVTILSLVRGGGG